MKKIVSLLVIIIFLITLIPSSVFSGKLVDDYTQKDYQVYNFEKYFNDYMLVRFNNSDDSFIMPDNTEIIDIIPGKYVDILLNYSELIKLKDEYEYIILDDNIFNSNLNVTGDYHSFGQMEDILKDITIFNPNITRLYSIGLSYENRDLWCLEISDNPGVDEDEPGVLFMGVHHAREWPTMEICLHIANELTSNYYTDPFIKEIIDNRRIWIIPCVNPDGYYYDHDLNDGITMWRKNRHFFPEFNTYGVDLNRNYGGSVNGDDLGMWGSIGISSVSLYYDSILFCGLDSMSELEVQSIRNFYIDNDICASISWHTYGEIVIWPWGYSTDVSTPDSEYLTLIGNEIADRIRNQDDNGYYTPYQSANFYPTTGDTDDWAYGYGHYVLGKPIFAYTIEACRSFHPNSDVLEQVCSENYDGALYLLNEAENISKVIPRVIPPRFNDVNYSSYNNFTISWDEINPDANPYFFQLDELSNLILITEDCEKDSDLWDLNGFIQTGDRYNSYNHCYQSHSSRSKVSSMTSLYPIPITDKSSLSFWCWYDINNYDMAFVEVSVDGRDFKILDKFTSSSDGWVFNSYNLKEYEGMSIFIRFRYTTDSSNNGAGFFVDDILAEEYYEDIELISDSIIDNYYEIRDKDQGIYYYRVRGYNDEHGWGDYSILKRVDIGDSYNEPPSTPIIKGIKIGQINKEYQYSFISNDPEDSDIYYYIDWGDGNRENWIGPYPSNEEIYLNHTWNRKDNYTIRVKVKDEYNLESFWGYLQISMPKIFEYKRIFITNFLKYFIDYLSIF